MTHAKTFYIIDGMSYIFRAFFALPPLTNSKKFPTGAIYGFNNMLLKLMREKKPDYLAVVFDRPEPTHRKIKYQEYKAQREAAPEDLVKQIEPIKNIVRAHQVPLLEMAGYEADDIIATLAKRFAKQGIHVYVVSGDKDLMQLIHDHVCMYDPMKDKIIREPEVVEKFGVKPNQVRDLLALMGDSSDNIPGIAGIGPKTAATLLNQYHTLDGVYQHVEELKGKQKEKMEQGKDAAYLSQDLATLHDNLDLNYSLDDFKAVFVGAGLPRPDQLKQLYQEYDFHKLLQEISVGASASGGRPPIAGGADRRALGIGGTRGAEPVTPPLQLEWNYDKYELIDTLTKWQQLYQKLQNQKEFALDTETDSLNFISAKLVGISFALAEGEAYYLPLAHQQKTEVSLAAIRKDLTIILINPKIGKIFQNYKYDAHILKNIGMDILGLSMDTMIASYLLDPASEHNMDYLASRYFQHQTIKYKVVTEGKKDFSEVDLATAKNYSCEDADVTLRLHHQFKPMIEQENLNKVLYDIELPTSKVLLKMERAGILLDEPYLKKLSHQYQKQLIEIEAHIYQLAGSHFNIQSPKQLGKILFEDLKLPVIKKTKTGCSTDVEVLETLSTQHELPAKILAYRSLAKLLSTYIDALPLQINPQTGRVHTTYQQTIAETGRLSSVNPNLQNIPIRTEDGRKIRAAFIAAPGCYLLSADYSQIELRLLAHFSEDPHLMVSFAKNEDVHKLTASKIFGVALNQVTHEQRAVAKTVNFGVIYGQSPFGLSKQLGISQSDAKKYIDQYFLEYPGVQVYRKKILDLAKQELEVRTLFSRRRKVLEMASPNQMLRGMAERLAFNTVLQGTAADLMKLAMIHLDEALEQAQLKTKILLQVHDELVLEVPEAELQQVQQLTKKYMENVFPLKVPLQVNIGFGKNWDEAHS